jgi:F-type H+-transporting ATPase subunit gamma
MASLKEVKSKISGVKKTKQITKAMKMVATSKLRGCQMVMESFRPYAKKFAEVLSNIVEKAGEESSPLMTPRDEVRSVHVVLVTSDRGLCGGFNMNLLEKAESLMSEQVSKGYKVSFTNFGKKGRDWSRKTKVEVANTYLNIVGSKFGFTVASKAGQEIINGFLGGNYDEVYIVYATYLSMANQPPVVRQLLPIPVVEKKESSADTNTTYMAEHIIEPSPEELLNEMLPRNIYIQLYNALLETSTSEHAARMRAMDNATKACDDMIDSLTLTYNKARQASITKELMDIVGGAEALRG